ncbi:Uncharacterised protein [Staphylococcus xylosus]|nr:Uncharacterised protein [Staphylococcus xylosus]
MSESFCSVIVSSVLGSSVFICSSLFSFTVDCSTSLAGSTSESSVFSCISLSLLSFFTSSEFCSVELFSSTLLISLISNASPLSLVLPSSVVIDSSSSALASLPIPITKVAPINNDAVPTVNFLIEYLFNLLGKNPCLFFIIFPPQIYFFTTQYYPIK